ncbi:MAG: Ig-like domain-containing protein [Thermoanaerobaculia bacterium]
MRNRLAATAAGAVCALAVACGQKPASIQVSPAKVKIHGLERPQRLTARVLDRKGQPLAAAPALYWSSSRPDVVEVDSGGRLLSKKEGRSVVTVTLEGLSTQISVEVLDVKSVEIVPMTARLLGPPGSSLPLKAAVKNSRDQSIELPVTWSSSDEKVATVSPEGVVASAGPGKATIVAKMGDLQTGVEIVVDTRTVGKLLLLPATALVRVGDSQHYEVRVYGADGREIEGASARFSSSNPAVASVDTAGVASGLKAGVATIRAQVGNLTAEATVLVN